MVKSEILLQFFNICNGYEELFKSNYADLYLMQFIYFYSCNFDKDKNCILIPDSLYNYNKTNNSSICNNNKKLCPLILGNEIKINKEYYITGMTT
jgi:hypothetical protein